MRLRIEDMVTYAYIVIIGIFIILFSWCFAYLKYLHIYKIIKKTQTDVNSAVEHVTSLEKQVDNFRIIVNSINSRINDIELKFKKEPTKML